MNGQEIHDSENTAFGSDLYRFEIIEVYGEEEELIDR